MNTTIGRWIVGTLIAAFVTFALFVMMMVLIKGDFVPQEKPDQVSFEINPKVDDIKLVARETKIAQVRKELRRESIANASQVARDLLASELTPEVDRHLRNTALDEAFI